MAGHRFLSILAVLGFLAIGAGAASAELVSLPSGGESCSSSFLEPSADWLSPLAPASSGFRCPTDEASCVCHPPPPVEWAPVCGCVEGNLHYVVCSGPAYTCGAWRDCPLCGCPSCYCRMGPCWARPSEQLCPFVEEPTTSVSPDVPCVNGEAPAAPAAPTSVPNPVSVTTGKMFLTHTDAVVGDVSYSRSYNSGRHTAGRYGSFGPGWNSSVEARLVVPANQPRIVEARSSDGNPQYYFHADPNAVRLDATLPYSTASWIERVFTGGVVTGYRRVFRAGHYETYDGSGRLQSLTERSGLQTTYTRDSQGRLSSVSRLGRGITIEYDGSATRPARLRGPGGVLLASYTYLNGRLDKVEYADGVGSGFRYGYDGGLRLNSVTDLEGKKLEAHTYSGERAQTSEKGDGVEKLTLSYLTNKTTVTDARQNVTTYEYTNVRGMRMVTKVIGPCLSCGGGGGDVQEWRYDGYGRIESYKDGEGNLTTYTYDLVTGDLLTETRKPDAATTLVTRYTYHPDGRLKSREDPRGGLTTWTYETVGGEEKETVTRLVTAGQSRTTEIWRNTIGKPRLIIDPLERTTELFYTAQGDLDYVKDPAGKETHFTYDALGRRTQTINPPVTPPALEPRFEYDVRGRVRKIIDPTDSNKFTEITYDRGGRRIKIQDTLQRGTDRRTELLYDAYGRPEFLKQWLSSTSNQTTQFHYDLMSNLEWIKDARGKQRTFEYDGFNRVKKAFHPPDSTEMRVEEFGYDGAGRLETRTDRRGIVTTYAYDGLGRIIGKSYAGGTVQTAPVTFGYDEAGNLTSASDGSSSLSWTYNLTGEPESTTQELSGAGPSLLASLAYGYNDAGNRTSLDTGLGFSLAYDYDMVGRLWHIVNGSDSFTFAYDDASRRRSLTYPNKVVTSLTPDNQSRLDILEVLRGTTTLDRFDYGYDDVGNRTSKTTPGLAETYTYDAVYQLDNVLRNAVLAEDFNHDPVGNRQGTLALPSPGQWAYSSRNELLTAGVAGYSYDLNGNLTGKSDSTGTWTYEWDAENRMTRVTRNAAEVATYRYDPLGRRVEKLVNGVRTTYVYDGETILRERIGSEDRYFVHGPHIDEPLSRVVGSTATYFHADGLGSIVSHTDTTGSVIYSRSYDAFGNLETGGSEAGYAFTGREWDPETGLYYYRARYYDPKIGRFLSEDPIGFDGGINFYAYVDNNPCNAIDPYGLQAAFPVVECKGPKFQTPAGPRGHICCEKGQVAICIPQGQPSPHRECLITHEEQHALACLTNECSGGHCEPLGSQTEVVANECRPSQKQYECLQGSGVSEPDREYVRKYAISKGCDVTGPVWAPKPPSPKPPSPKPRRRR